MTKSLKNVKNEEAAFALENEQVSEIVETEDGFYLLKCVNNFDREATEVNKVTMVEKRRDEIFGKVYAELIGWAAPLCSRRGIVEGPQPLRNRKEIET